MTSESMVEKVATALMKVEISLPGAGGLRGNLTIRWALAQELARAAIAAMREPTEEMKLAGADAITGAAKVNPPKDFATEVEARECFTAMIDSALSHPMTSRDGERR